MKFLFHANSESSSFWALSMQLLWTILSNWFNISIHDLQTQANQTLAREGTCFVWEEVKLTSGYFHCSMQMSQHYYLGGLWLCFCFFFTGDLQQHLQIMFTLLRPEDTIRLVTTIIQSPDLINQTTDIRMLILSLSQAVRLESAYTLRTRYMVIVSTNGRQDTEESVVLGMDFSNSDRSV